MVRRFMMTVLVLASMAVASLGMLSPARAFDIPCESDNNGQCKIIKSGGSLADNIWPIVSFALGILAGLAVIVIIIAGFYYVISAGDSQKVTAAKNIILYAVIGLIVALFATSIVAIVNTYFGKS